ncbi:MAG: methyl-accepting chemotaxis protein [Pseudomonadota bacterium]
MSSLDHKFSAGEEDVALEAIEAPDILTIEDENGWLSRMPLVRKLNLAVFGNTFVLAAIALIMLAGTLYLGELGRAQAVITSVEVQSNNSAIALNDAADALADMDDDAQAANLANAAANLDLAFNSLDRSIEFAGDKMPAELGPKMNDFRDRIEDIRSQIDAARSGEGDETGLAAETKQLYSDLSRFAVELHPLASAQGDALFAQLSAFLIAFFVLAFVGIAISILASRHIVRDITETIRAMTGSMEQLAQGDTDAAIPGAHRGDEIGAMARAFTVFRERSLELNSLTETRVREAQDQLAQQQTLSQQMRDLRREKSQMLEGMADGFEVSVGELINAVSAASVQLKATSEQMVAVADGSNDQANSASEAMERASANVTAAAAATDEFALSIGEISQQASASASLARDASTLVSSANARMTELSNAAVEIGEIIELIQTIAQRTNLFALNASIEAARGGEAGRGFAVVASEVKELAMQTSNATSSVTERITAMQDSSRSSASDLSSIVDQIGELEKAAVMIATAVDQQSVSGDELARNIDTVASGSAQISERLTQLRGASQETGSAADDVVASAEALGQHAEELRDKAGRFISDVRRSAHELDLGAEDAA